MRAMFPLKRLFPVPFAFRLFRVVESCDVAGIITKALGRVVGVSVGLLVGGCVGALKKLDKDKATEMALVAAIRTALSMGANLYLKSGINANIRYYLDFSEKDIDVATSQQAAESIAQHLSDFRPERIGVDGLPGSGKTTLSLALAKQMGMKWVCLDHHLYTSAAIDLSRSGVIYEHHRLFRTQDLDQFDVLVYIDEPLETIERQILNRGRGAAMLDVFDFARMQAVGKKAFQIAGGETWRVPDTNVLWKRRPGEGFQERKRLENELKGMGFAKTEDLPKEALLFLVTFGKAKEGALAYLQIERFLTEFVDTAANEISRQALP